jgi:hypothetical protein
MNPAAILFHHMVEKEFGKGKCFLFVTPDGYHYQLKTQKGFVDQTLPFEVKETQLLEFLKVFKPNEPEQKTKPEPKAKAKSAPRGKAKQKANAKPRASRNTD